MSFRRLGTTIAGTATRITALRITALLLAAPFLLERDAVVVRGTDESGSGARGGSTINATLLDDLPAPNRDLFDYLRLVQARGRYSSSTWLRARSNVSFATDSIWLSQRIRNASSTRALAMTRRSGGS